MISDGYLVGDGSWQLKIFVTDLKVERTLRVKGDLHVGGVMLKLVEELGLKYFYVFHIFYVSLFLCFTFLSFNFTFPINPFLN
jgi:kindlin 2